MATFAKKERDQQTKSITQNTTYKTKDGATRNLQKIGEDFRCSGRMG